MLPYIGRLSLSASVDTFRTVPSDHADFSTLSLLTFRSQAPTYVTLCDLHRPSFPRHGGRCAIARKAAAVVHARALAALARAAPRWSTTTKATRSA
eukprot:3873334-Prymnesium_polylepis.1